MNDPVRPQILLAEKNFLVVYKPPKTHTAPLAGGGDSLAEWCAGVYPEIMDINGRRRNEGGLFHRLDYETNGLVLFARDQAAFDSFAAQQEEGVMVKEYRALTAMHPHGLAGFPPASLPPESLVGETAHPAIESAFRPYGRGRKEVRPVVDFPQAARRRKETAFDKGGFYRTEILGVSAGSDESGRRQTGEGSLQKTSEADGTWCFKLSICRGFRHQIRCHLAWAGFPIVNDAVYGGSIIEDGILKLRASALRFRDPAADEELCFYSTCSNGQIAGVS